MKTTKPSIKEGSFKTKIMLKKDPLKPVKMKPMKVKSTTDMNRPPAWWEKIKQFLKKSISPDNL